MNLDGEALLGRCEDIVRKATARGADGAEVYMVAARDMELDVEKDRVHSANSDRTRGGSVRTIQDGRLGFAYFTDPDQAEPAVAAALQAARHAPEKPFTLPEGGPLPDLRPRWDDAVAHMEPPTALMLAEDLVQGAKEACPEAVVGGGGVGATASCHAIASSTGIACHDRASRLTAAVSLLLRDGERSVNAWDMETVYTGDLDVHGLAGRVAERVGSLRGPEPVASGGRFDVVLEPHAADLVTDLVAGAVHGDDAMRGKTVWSDRLGETVGAEHLHISDDPLHPDGIGVARFDDEGLPARRLPLIEGGVLRNFTFDAWDAAEHDKASTRSAVRSGFKNPPGTGIHHMVLESDHAMPREKLFSGIEDGFLVESVLGAHTANATTGEFSVTAPNIWRIRDGEVVGASGEVALSGSLTDWLERLDATDDRPRTMEGLRVPALRFRDVQVSV